MLVICSECSEGAEHIYCMQTLLCNIPEGDWFCDDCKLKFNERDQSKAITDSPLSSLSQETFLSQETEKQIINENSALSQETEKQIINENIALSKGTEKQIINENSALSQGTEKQIINENTALKVLSSTELKLSSDKMQMQKSTDNTVECNKRQRDDSNKASANKKQATGFDNVQVNASQSLLKRNSSCKVLETSRADSCEGLPQIKIPVNPRYTREGSLKISGAGKYDSSSITPLASKNSTPRSLSRESSLKTAETGKVKFLPVHTVASLCSGMTVRESAKFTGKDGNSDSASYRTGLIDPHQTSSRGGSIPITDSAGPVNRSGYQSSFRSASAYSSLRSSGLSKSEDVFPSFLLSSRSNTPRGHLNLRSKEATNGNGQYGLAGNTSAKMGNTRISSSRRAPTSFNHPIDNNVNDDVNEMSKHSFGTSAVSIVEKSKTDIAATPVRNSGCSKPDELTLAKENSHLISSSAEKCSAVPTQVLQPQESTCEEYKGYSVAKQSPEGLILTNKVVKDIVSTEHSNVLHSDTQGPAGMKSVKGIINMSELSHQKNGNQLPDSVLVENDGVLTHPTVSPSMKLVMEDTEVSDVLKGRLPKVDGELLIKETEMLKLRKDNCKHPDAATADDKATVRVGEDVSLSVSNKQVVSGSLDKQTSEEVIPQTSVKMSMDKDIVKESSSTLDDNTSGALLGTTQNTSSEMILRSSDGKMEIKPISKVIIRERLNSSTYISAEANVQPTKGSSKGPFSLGRSPEKHLLPTSTPYRFGREVLMDSQSDKSIVQPLEINVSSSASMQSQVHSPSSKKYAMGIPLQGMVGFTQQKVPTRPESLFLWRGGFEIINEISEHWICDGMQAHPSNKSSLKVYEESRKFPSQLLLEQVQRYDAWPKRFEESPPTDEDIALYIFPVEAESCKIQYFELLEATIKQDLALRVYLECAELLIFASNQLPESYHRYNGQMYLWGVFRGRKKITLAVSHQQFTDCNNVGNDVQPSPSPLLMKNNNPLPTQLTSTNASGCSEGEEDMDVDMEGGREIGMAERPATRSEPQVANAMEDDATTSVISNSKHVLIHHENLKSGNRMPFEQDGLPLVASWSNSAKILGTIPEMKGSIGVDIQGERDLGMSKRSNPRPESKLANMIERSVAHTSALSNSLSKLTHHDNPKLGRIISFEQGRNSSFASRHGSAEILGNIPEYMPSTGYVKDAERRNEQSSTCYTNNELEFPPGFELPPVCHHSSAISRSNRGKHIEAMPENMNSFGIHAKLQGGELPPGLEVLSDNTKSSINNLASGFSSQVRSHPPTTVLSEEFPPGFHPASLKASMSSPDYPPGLEPASLKPPVSSPNCPPGLETTHMKSLLSSPVCLPSLESTYIKPLVFSAECQPGVEATLVKPLVTFPGCPPGLEHKSMKPLVSSPDFPPGLEPVFVKPRLFSPDCPPGLETTSMKPVVSSEECYPGLEAVLAKPSATFPDCPSSVVPYVQNPSFPLHNSCVTEPAEGMPDLSSSECPPGVEAAIWNRPLTSLDHPPGFDSASGKSLFPSGQPLENLACKQLQDKPDLEVENKVEPIRQRSSYLLSGKDDSSRDRTKIYNANGRRGVTHTDSFTSVTREADKGTYLANIYKNRSPREEYYHGRRRERNDGRRDKSRSREKEYNWKRSGNSNREKECTRERHRNYNREMERRKERHRNYGREKESKKEHGRKDSGEEQGTRNRERKSTERESARNRDSGYHRHRSRYVGTRRHNDYDKHSHSLHDCSNPESTTRSYMGGGCLVDATEKTTSSHHANSSFSGSNIEHHNHKSLSLEKDSENREDAGTVNLHSREAIMDIDSVQLPRSEYCPLESHSLHDCSNPESTTRSYMGGECIVDATGKTTSSHHANSSISDSNIEHHNHISLSLEKDSENREDAVTVNLHSREAIMDIDSVQSPRSEYCPLESEEKFQNIEASRKLTDHHFLLCDLNDDPACDHEISDQKNLSVEAFQETTQVNISDNMISRTEYAFLHSGKLEQHVIPIQHNWSSGSRMTMHDSVQCLPLFPIKGNCGEAESSLSDWDFNLELGLGQRTKTNEPLPLLEQSSLQSRSCNFMFDKNSSNSRSRLVFDNSREPSPAEISILSLSMPQYRRQGNSWVEVTEDTELPEEVDADLKLTLSMI
ncbi:uncharacterized protein LOC131063371 isoform X2 [Cryptomeria japonica]|nr:uncharacterized protein LOC131063371 isoform X2 [Cryptomeria japonica]